MKQSFSARNKKRSHLCCVDFFIVDVIMALTPPLVHIRPLLAEPPPAVCVDIIN